MLRTVKWMVFSLIKNNLKLPFLRCQIKSVMFRTSLCHSCDFFSILDLSEGHFTMMRGETYAFKYKVSNTQKNRFYNQQSLPWISWIQLNFDYFWCDCWLDSKKLSWTGKLLISACRLTIFFTCKIDRVVILIFCISLATERSLIIRKILFNLPSWR